MKNNQTTERLLAASRSIWEGYLSHPFVRGIADGSLDAQKFRFYLLQDYLYLFDYAKVFAQGVVKSREPAVMRVFASYVASILNGEMEIHRGYMKRLGITEEQAESVKPSLSNLSYTAYMRAGAAEEGPAEMCIRDRFCTSRYGWGWKNFKEEANEGGGLKIRDWMRFYVSYILPLIVLAMFVIGITDKFFA